VLPVVKRPVTHRAVTLPTTASGKCHAPRSVTAGDTCEVSRPSMCHDRASRPKPLNRRRKSGWVTLVTLLFFRGKELREIKKRGGGVGGIESLEKIAKSSVTRHGDDGGRDVGCRARLIGPTRAGIVVRSYACWGIPPNSNLIRVLELGSLSIARTLRWGPGTPPPRVAGRARALGMPSARIF
jgi:hypothetical protein